MKKHILVTGGTGYIGSPMGVRLIEAGMEPIIFDNFSNSKPAVVDRIEMITGKRPTLVRGDIRDEKALEKLFADFPIDAVINFAGRARPFLSRGGGGGGRRVRNRSFALLFL